jgi:hypothetical protein
MKATSEAQEKRKSAFCSKDRTDPTSRVDSAAKSQQGGNKKKKEKRQRLRTLDGESTEGEDGAGAVAPAPSA